ncbi:MAG: SDR family oxidoreductase, partial [Anaerolineae bacterium]
EAVERAVIESKAEAVIHCAALADVDACEANPELAHRTNAVMPRLLAEAARRRGIRFLHISTDAVFSGLDSGPYTEDDQPDPLGVYAITKLEGERAVLRAYPAASVLRVNFFGWSLSGRGSLAEFFVNRLSEGSNVNGFTDVTFCPMFVGDLAQRLLTIMERDLPGVYHLVGPQAMTKYQFGVEIAQAFGLEAGLIAPQSVERSSLTAKRSHNLWLSTHKISTVLQQELPEFSTGLRAFYTQYQQGYPQKIRSYQQAAKAAQLGA